MICWGSDFTERPSTKLLCKSYMRGVVVGCGYGVFKMPNENEKKEKIKKEKNKIKRVFAELDANKKKLVEPLIEKAAFMSVTLDELQEQINAEGCVSEYQNGANQYGTKKSPEIEIYLNMSKNYANIIKQLTELVPPAKRKNSKLDELRRL